MADPVDLIPGGPQVKAGVRLTGYVLAGIAVLLVVAIVGGFLTDPFHWKEKVIAKQTTRADQAQAQAVVSGAQAQAAQATITVIAKSATQQLATARTEQEHRDAILALPSAGQLVPDDLAGVFVDGLCAYRAYDADVSCHRLQPVDPEQPAPAGAGDGPPT